MDKLPKSLLEFFFHFIAPYKFRIAFLFLSMLFWATAISLQPYLLKDIIDNVVVLGDDTDKLLDAVFWPAIIYISLFEIININYRLFDYCSLKTFPRLKRDIRMYMFHYVQHHSYSFFQKNYSGSLVTKIADTAKGMEAVIMLLVDPIFAHLAALLIAAGMMYFVHPFFCIVLIVWSAIFIAITILVSKRSQYYSRKLTESRSKWMGAIVDSLMNIINVHLFAQNNYEEKYLLKKLQKNVKRAEKLEWYVLKVKIFQGTASTVLMGCMMYLLVDMRTKGLVTVGDFAFILTLSVTIVRAVWYLAGQLVKFSKEIGVCKQALNVIRIPHEIQDIKGARPIRVIDGSIKFNKVSFNYGNGNFVFKDQDIEIKAGEKVGLVGQSGAGKSTFVNLLLRYFDVESGMITIDGQDISQVTHESLRKYVGVIPQETMLFHRSLIENIRYGRLDATDEEVINAAKLAHCHEFILETQYGYDTIVGERGIRLSGGQRQRIAIARAILKKAPILILDEATSALDSITEKLIQESLSYLMNNSTTIAIAHRLSTLSGMDRIIVFKDGHIYETGTHKELIKKGGHYATLWKTQDKGFML